MVFSRSLRAAVLHRRQADGRRAASAHRLADRVVAAGRAKSCITTASAAKASVRPGGVNVMTSGAGIAHAEETPRRNIGRLNGLQLWIALPDAHRHVAPSFQPLPGSAEARPARRRRADLHRRDGRRALAGRCVLRRHRRRHRRASRRNAVAAGTCRSRACAVRHGRRCDRSKDQPLTKNTLYYLGTDRTELALRSANGARVLLLGGVPFAERILMWWNFVARTPEEMAAARADWEEGRFGNVPYDGPRIPAPPLTRFAPPNPASWFRSAVAAATAFVSSARCRRTYQKLGRLPSAALHYFGIANATVVDRRAQLHGLLSAASRPSRDRPSRRG